MNTDALKYIEAITAWIVDRNLDLASEARAHTGLTGVYAGSSARIHRLVRLAFLRGVREGAYRAWEARQPIGLKSESDRPSASTTPTSPERGPNGHSRPGGG